ncbi:cation-translocating P-type ATPase [Romboutsia sp.]|uniref:cation-translocating P-type ATPase n=1 Tax=Romboutsia sp. TaxID=1965302 RepID=UPI003F2B18CA
MYRKQIKSTTEEFNVDLNNGLSSEEAKNRLLKDGPNSLVEKKKKTKLQMFLCQLNEPMIYILIVAAVISFALKEISDSIIIIAVVLINGVIGMIQEGKAQDALETLKKLSAPKTIVKRDGKQVEVDAKDLVLGDVVLLEAGRQIPADLRLTFSSNLKIEESALTGESVPSEKNALFMASEELPLGDRINMAYMSTSVSYGRGEGVVVATGMDTEIGKIASMINESTDTLTPLQKRLADLGKLLGIIAIVLCVSLFGIAILQDRNIVEMLITAISLAVAAVPEGLPAVVTIVLALGVQRLVKVNTIVRRLPSVETLGSVSIVCSDKTGTLTQNKMTVVECFTNGSSLKVNEMIYSQHKVFVDGFMLCNDSSVRGNDRFGDPTELALVDMGIKIGLTKDFLEKDQPRVNELPFDSDRKMMSTVHQFGDNKISYTKGASDSMLVNCKYILENNNVRPITDNDLSKINQAIKNMSNQALRVLVLSAKYEKHEDFEKDMVFVGLVGMIDPPREEVTPAIKSFKGAGVRTIMITGDHKDTAFAIAKQLGIAESIEQCMTGMELDLISQEELATKIDDLCVFARVSPQHKVLIVQTLKSKGYIVSMTGDGVNDAPSLKAADIGIAMGITGTDVAKSASDMVLTDDNFATIEKAISEGRGIYANIRKSVLFLLSSNFGEIITMFLSIICGLASPLKAIHILWVNLITDSLPGLALGVDENDKDYIMKQRPRDPNESIFANGGLTLTLFYGTVIAAITLSAFVFEPVKNILASGLSITLENLITALNDPEVLKHSQTYAFTVLALSQLFHAIGMRNVDKSIFSMNHLENKMMIAAFVIGFILQIAVTEVPFLVAVFGTTQLHIVEWVYLILLSTVPLIFHEIIVLGKMIRNK